MEVECIGNTQIIHMEETGMTQANNWAHIDDWDAIYKFDLLQSSYYSSQYLTSPNILMILYP